MKEVMAYEDNAGRLHKTRREAVVCDFISKMQSVWGKMPDQRDRGDPVVIGRILGAGAYCDARICLTTALQELDAALAKCGD